jgi:hypothetical protein
MPTEIIPGLWQALTYAAKTYLTNFKNSIVSTFRRRQKALIKTFVEAYRMPKEDIHSLQCGINGWKCRTPPPDHALDFVHHQRGLLFNPAEGPPPAAGITDSWLLSHLEQVVKYFWSIQRRLSQEDKAKKFSLAPVHEIRRHFVTIDTRCLWYMLRNAALFEGSEQTFRTLAEEHWASCFNWRGLCPNGEFANMVQTDGVSICFHFLPSD